MDSGNMKKVFSEIRRQIESMYAVTYVPAYTTNQQVHSFKLAPASDKKLKLRSPLGFHVATENP
jgi:hypothetical protein